MEKSKKLNYVLNYESKELLDLAFGVELINENGQDKIGCGLGSHGITFPVSEILKEDESKIRFKVPNGEIISLKIITAVDYRKLKGILFSENCPVINDDTEVQEFITSERGY